jgi:hypothetical protein
VDIKALVWNGKGRDYEEEQVCNTYGTGHRRKTSTSNSLPKDVVDVLFPTHSGFKGFKMYHPSMSCCEVRVNG